MAKQFSKQFAVGLCCLCLDLAKSTYYSHQDKESSFEAKYLHLKNKIKQIIIDNSAYGYRRIADELKEEHKIIINHKALRKLLKLWNFNILRTARKPKRSGIDQILTDIGPLANLIKKLTPDMIKPFRLIYTDITEIACKAGKLYLMPFLDHKTKKVIGYEVSVNSDLNFLLRAFNKAIFFLKNKKITFSEIIIHQDQGSIFKAYNYVGELIKRGITLSYSRKGRPADNPEMESFFGRLKTEKNKIFVEASSLQELEQLIHEAIRYYNAKRRHSSLGNKSPDNFIELINLNLQTVSA